MVPGLCRAFDAAVAGMLRPTLCAIILWGIPKVDSNLSPLPKVDSSVLRQIVIVVLRSKIDSDDGPRT